MTQELLYKANKISAQTNNYKQILITFDKDEINEKKQLECAINRMSRYEMCEVKTFIASMILRKIERLEKELEEL